MPIKTNRLAAATSIAAAISLLATPVSARDHHRRWHHDDDIDAGDVIAGALIIGGLAAIFGAAKRANQQPVPRPVPYPDEDAGYRVPGAYERSDSRGIDRAVDICVGIVEERGADRVGTVDAATRAADGWRVSGQLEGGAPYSCTIGSDGQIGDVFVGDPAVASAPADGQWDDQAYAKARVDSDDDGRYETAQAPDFE